METKELNGGAWKEGNGRETVGWKVVSRYHSTNDFTFLARCGSLRQPHHYHTTILYEIHHAGYYLVLERKVYEASYQGRIHRSNISGLRLMPIPRRETHIPVA